MEGRFLYEQPDKIEAATSWAHPRGLDFGDPPPCPPAGFEPRYEALSYVWGDLMDTEVVGFWLDAKTSSSRHGCLQITSSLAVALRHLRQSNESRRMWVDALCINQNDHIERSHQVLRMRDIYRLAARVIVWVEEAIYHLSARPWFSRVWTIQEFQLGNQHCVVQCGNASISRRCLRIACSRLLSHNFRPYDDYFHDRMVSMFPVYCIHVVGPMSPHSDLGIRERVRRPPRQDLR